ncbi:tuberoinfundibular peptide [Huso huso]|uniref:Tuberoinfundibular peptide of 39 residues n=1 Tax=Huso huso TaxID=61971 RepID=A0ABR0Z3Q5_HUSHU
MKTLSAPRSRSLCLALLLSGVLSSGYTLPHLRSLDSSSLSSPPISEDNDSPRRHTQWEVLYPSISLRDWSVQMMSPPELPAPKLKPRLLSALAWLPSSQSVEESLVREAGLGKSWPSDWSAQAVDAEKRNIVVADDAAFREKSKLLTAMERQKWLNSYMQKLLVVNSQ